ncbi:MAG: cadmium-translocating P-type ATPase [Chitinophagaceae bacterium]|nr:cadmium-translocating P-type ATPase [Chitinophagaceae bacterium]
MDQVNWKVEGMTCSNCALTIDKYLRNQGATNVKVNLVGGEVIFDPIEKENEEKLHRGIESMGYKVVDESVINTQPVRKTMNRFLKYVLICAPFTLILMLHMIPGVHAWAHWLMNPWLQLALCLPVYLLGMSFFAKSAFSSIRNGMPNMNVLITIGASAAFFYSLVGTLMGQGDRFLFYETAATIITLVFLGNYLEDASIDSTQRALNKLAKSQRVMANMIAFDDQHKESIFPIDNMQLRSGDLVLIKSGEQVPADAKILWGEATVDEAIITGESLPISKKQKDQLIGGSIVTDGTVKAQVTAGAKDSVLANIVNLVKQAQGEKPPIQQMADRISAIFVPVVLGITAVTFILNYIFLGQFTESLMRSIAVLVIACPCAMGLATPAAIAVGLGRATKSGILFRKARSLELFKNIQQVVFDKTGTLTTGKFVISSFQSIAGLPDEELKQLAFSLEKYSNHPIAKAIVKEWKTKNEIRWQKVEEIKGTGIRATDKEGNEYWAGSFAVADKLTSDESHNVYLLKNNQLIGWIDVADEIRPEAADTIEYLHSKGIKTVLLTGDRKAKAIQIAQVLGIDEVIAEQSPAQKLEHITRMNAITPTAMVGDGINDAPALAKATIGISMSDASQVAMQTADVVLMNNGLKNLPTALGLGKHTFITIQQNLFWAFAYNIVAIPVAAFGLLGEYGPTYGALIMALSDVVLAINSVRLFVKKVV